MYTIADEDYVWLPKVKKQAQERGHIIYGITGSMPTRRSIVLWSCSYHPDGGLNIFKLSDSKLKELLKNGFLSEVDIENLITSYPRTSFLCISYG